MNRFGGLLLALGVLAAGLGLARWLTAPPPVSVVYLEADPAGAWTGISTEERAGILVLLQEALELDRRLTVLQERPVDAAAGSCRTWKLSAGRRGDRLHLRLRDERGRIAEAEAAPLASIQQVFTILRCDRDGLARFLPADSAAFWELAELSGPFTFEQLRPRRAQSLALAERFPASAAVQYRAAYAHLRLLIVEASSQADALETCDRLFQQALARLPGYPRALYQYCRFKTDIGAGRDSLDLAMRLRDGFPNHPLAYGALAYAGRNAGLLEGAEIALLARESLVGALIADPGLGENTHLYRGDLDRFERSLVSAPGTPASPIRMFYQGYARLLRGDRSGALPLFRECHSEPGRVIQFEALAEVYECALTQRTEEALARLRSLRDTRTQLRVPDGEFTFKLAEAFALLGSHSEAVDMAASAFAQGFGCTRWYRNAPLLREVQPSPRWQALLKHLQEREGLLAERFPARAFRRK